MNILKATSRQDIITITGITTLLIAYHTQAWHNIPPSYGIGAIILSLSALLGTASKWTAYSAGMLTGMAICEKRTAFPSTFFPSWSLSQLSVLGVMIIFNFALAKIIEYIIDKCNA